MTMQAAVTQACYEGDVSSIRTILEATQSATIRSSYLHSALRTAIRQNSLLVLTYLLNFGVDLTTLGGSDIQSKGALKPIIELLLAYGWHIDTRAPTGNNRQPLLWCIVHDAELVNWCLARGARVRMPELHNRFSCASLLEVAAQRASVATFQLLQGRGADLGPRTLHLAAQSAVFDSDGPEDDSVRLSKRYQERIAMVHYLIHTVKLDVNAWDRDPSVLCGPLLHGTPLNYVSEICFSSRNACCEDVTWLLLDAGADVTRARHGTRASLDLPLEEDIIPFVEAVEKWQRRKNHITETSIQCEAEKNSETSKIPASCSMA